MTIFSFKTNDLFLFAEFYKFNPHAYNLLIKYS